MDLAKIKRLLAIVGASDVAEVEIEEEGLRVVVRKNAATVMMPPPPAYPAYQVGVLAAAPAPGETPPAPSPAGTREGGQALPTNETQAAGADASGQAAVSPGAGSGAAAEEYVVRAPIVGTFYRASSPESKPFVEVGDHVASGDILCIIEAMKLMNEIESDVTGILRRVLVENAEPVEYDQPLFVIEPE